GVYSEGFFIIRQLLKLDEFLNLWCAHEANNGVSVVKLTNFVGGRRSKLNLCIGPIFSCSSDKRLHPCWASDSDRAYNGREDAQRGHCEYNVLFPCHRRTHVLCCKRLTK